MTARRTQPRPPEIKPLLSLRSAVIFTLAAILGLAVGGLTRLAGHNLPEAVLAGAAAALAAVVSLNRIIGT